MKSTTTREDITDEDLKMTDKFELDPTKLSGVTTDGGQAMIGKRKGFSKKFLKAFGSQSVFLDHCIIHQEYLCSMDDIDIVKEVVLCINYIRNRGLNHG